MLYAEHYRITPQFINNTTNRKNSLINNLGSYTQLLYINLTFEFIGQFTLIFE